MIDHFAIGLTHALMLLAAWRLLSRPDLDSEGAVKRGWRKDGPDDA
jgi:hypothetical protein